MTSQEHEQYEWLLEKSFDADNPMPPQLVQLHEVAYSAGRRIGLTSVSKSTMVCLAIMAGCFDGPVTVVTKAVDCANVKPAPVLGPVKRRPGRPTNKERALAEVT